MAAEPTDTPNPHPDAAHTGARMSSASHHDHASGDGGTDRGWRAHLSLEFRSERGRTVFRRRHTGPLYVQRAFHQGDGVCHVYVLHPPGGLAGGDRVILSCAAESGTAALVTTPAATKFYRTAGPQSRQQQIIRVAPDASFEWLPLDTILFGGSRAQISTEVRLAAASRFVGWEMTSIGRRLSGDDYPSGRLDQRTEIFVDGEPLLVDRMLFEAGDPILVRAWGLGELDVFGSLYAFPADSRVLARARQRLDAFDALRAGATCVDDLLVVRALAPAADALREAFESIWAAIRVPVIGRAPSAPRIWRT